MIEIDENYLSPRFSVLKTKPVGAVDGMLARDMNEPFNSLAPGGFQFDFR